jgi:hypothetical protein
VSSSADFLIKLERVLQAVRDEVPRCCAPTSLDLACA